MKKSLLAVAIASLVGVVGCSDSSGSNTTSSSDTPAATTGFAGVVNKGIVNKGKVEICDTFDENGCDSSGSYYETQETNASGSYTITDAPTATPLLVRVSKTDSSTTMKCDIAECTPENSPMVGTSNIQFGDSFEVEDDWELQAVIAEANSATETVNVNALTNIASTQAIIAANSGEITAELIDNANDAVKQAFGIDDDISTLGGVDLTDPVAVAAADPEEIEAATFSANMMTVDEDDITDMFSLNSDGGYTLDVDIISDIQDEVVALVEVVKTKVVAIAAEQNLSLTFTNIDEVVAEVEAFEPPIVVAPVDQFDSNVEEAKAFLSDVRAVYTAVDTDGKLSTGVEAFTDTLDGVDDLVSSEFEIVTDNVADAASAIIDAYEAELSSDGDYTFNGIEVTISNSGSTYSVEDPATLVVTVPTVDNCDDTSCDQPGETELVITNLDAGYEYTALSALGSITVTDVTSSGNETSGDTDIESVEFALTDVELNYTGSEDDFQYKGTIAMDFAEITGDYTETGNDDDGSFTDIFSAESAKINFTGSITNMADDTSTGVYFNLLVSNPSNFSYQISEMWSASGDTTAVTTTEETESDYIGLNIIAILSVDIEDANNNAVPASVELNTTRSAYDKYNTEVTVTYNGTDTILSSLISVDYDTEEETLSTLTVSNDSGVEAQLNNIEEDFMGDIFVDGVKVGSIEERNGLTMVTYTNGEVASIF